MNNTHSSTWRMDTNVAANHGCNDDSSGSTEGCGNRLAMLALTTISWIMCVMGVLGTGSLLVFIVRGKSKSAHNLLLLNQAVADAVAMGYWWPFFALDLTLNRPFMLSPLLCGFNGAVFVIVSVVCSVSLALITVNRYLHVCHLNTYRRYFASLLHTAELVLFMWLLGVLVALLPFLQDPQPYRYSPAFRACLLRDSASFQLFVLALLYVLPVLLVGYCNFNIYRSWRGALQRRRLLTSQPTKMMFHTPFTGSGSKAMEGPDSLAMPVLQSIPENAGDEGERSLFDLYKSSVDSESLSTAYNSFRFRDLARLKGSSASPPLWCSPRSRPPRRISRLLPLSHRPSTVPPLHSPSSPLPWHSPSTVPPLQSLSSPLLSHSLSTVPSSQSFSIPASRRSVGIPSSLRSLSSPAISNMISTSMLPHFLSSPRLPAFQPVISWLVLPVQELRARVMQQLQAVPWNVFGWEAESGVDAYQPSFPTCAEDSTSVDIGWRSTASSPLRTRKWAVSGSHSVRKDLRHKRSDLVSFPRISSTAQSRRLSLPALFDELHPAAVLAPSQQLLSLPPEPKVRHLSLLMERKLMFTSSNPTPESLAAVADLPSLQKIATQTSPYQTPSRSFHTATTTSQTLKSPRKTTQGTLPFMLRPPNVASVSTSSRCSPHSSFVLRKFLPAYPTLKNSTLSVNEDSNRPTSSAIHAAKRVVFPAPLAPQNRTLPVSEAVPGPWLRDSAPGSAQSSRCHRRHRSHPLISPELSTSPCRSASDLQVEWCKTASLPHSLLTEDGVGLGSKRQSLSAGLSSPPDITTLSRQSICVRRSSSYLVAGPQNLATGRRGSVSSEQILADTWSCPDLRITPALPLSQDSHSSNTLSRLASMWNFRGIKEIRLRNLFAMYMRERDRDVVRALCIVFLVVCASFLPFALIYGVSLFMRVAPEVRVLAIMLRFLTNTCNWVLYGVLNPSLAHSYTTLWNALCPCLRAFKSKLLPDTT